MLKQKLNQYKHILEQLDDFTRKNWEDNFTIEFTHDTTAIEGNTLTLIDTKMILEDGIVYLAPILVRQPLRLFPFSLPAF